MILGIDPGLNLGWAVLDEKGVLHSCGLNDYPLGVYDVIIEKPEVYPSTGSKQANDLITLAIGVGRISSRFREGSVTLVLPHRWKGNTPKDIHNQRVLNALSDVENQTYTRCTHRIAEGKLNNVIDAIGLAKYHFSGSRTGTV